MHCCHGKTAAIVFLVLGVLFLLSDLNVWTFFGGTLKWWTILFLIMGILGLTTCRDHNCQPVAKNSKPKK
tara:strand:- start:617 stop:826 length:210 start_codon:yes stop_codon:yes gene_type:complete